MQARRLSEAILEGCRLSPTQAVGYLCQSVKGASCALGAAYLATSDGVYLPEYFPDVNVLNCLSRIFGVDFGQKVALPVDPFETVTLSWAIMTLNDRHRWTREQIALWLMEKGL